MFQINRRRIADCMDGSQLIFTYSRFMAPAYGFFQKRKQLELGKPRTADAMVSSEKGDSTCCSGGGLPAGVVV